MLTAFSSTTNKLFLHFVPVHALLRTHVVIITDKLLHSRTELEETEKKLGDLRIDVDSLESTLMEPQADKAMAEKVQPDVVLLDQHYIELQKLQREIDRLEAKLPAGSTWKKLQFLFFIFCCNVFGANHAATCKHASMIQFATFDSHFT
jgi:hypothetical protein